MGNEFVDNGMASSLCQLVHKVIDVLVGIAREEVSQLSIILLIYLP